MKNILHLQLLVLCILSSLKSHAQSSPVWTHNINALPDPAYVFPVRTLNDAANNVFVLSTYYKTIGTVTTNKIYLRKYDDSGGLAWGLVYDNNGSGEPRGFDMAIDNGGNCYVAGGLMATPNFQPILLKVSAGEGL